MGIFNKKIKMLGRAGIIYSEEGIKYFINSECLSGSPDVVLYAKDISLYKPDSSKTIKATDKKVIVEKVKCELEKMGMKVEISFD